MLGVVASVCTQPNFLKGTKRGQKFHCIIFLTNLRENNSVQLITACELMYMHLCGFTKDDVMEL